MPFRRRALEISESTFFDIKSAKPEALKPERPKQDQGRMFTPSPMWAQFDVANNSRAVASLYSWQNDWIHAAEQYDRAILLFRDLMEHNPSVGTFGLLLVNSQQRRISAAQKLNDRSGAAACSKDALMFWSRLAEQHPDVPGLKTYADDAAKQDAEVAKWLANPATQP
jgi:hypothetical protein